MLTLVRDPAQRLAPLLWLVAALVATSAAASAQTGIFKTRRSASSQTLPLVLGGGFEFERDADQAQYDFPLLLQYSFTETFQVSAETALTHVESRSDDVETVTGLDDLETSVEYEFLRERRHRPSLTAFGGVKWSTATDSEIGSPGTDYSIGLIAAKEFDFFEVDLNAIYTRSGDADQRDMLELPIAVQYPLNHYFALAAEFGPTLNAGGSGESAAQTEYTLGAILRTGDFWTLEGGVVLRDDGSWQLLFGWEFSFAGDD